MRLNSTTRWNSLCLYCVRVLQVTVCILIAALCCLLLPESALGLNEPTNASIWACATTAALSLVVMKGSQ